MSVEVVGNLLIPAPQSDMGDCRFIYIDSNKAYGYGGNKNHHSGICPPRVVARFESADRLRTLIAGRRLVNVRSMGCAYLSVVNKNKNSRLT